MADPRTGTGLDAFMQGLGAFNQGVQDLAVFKAVEGARAQAQDVRRQVQDEQGMLAGLRGVAEDLTLRLSGLGLPAERVRAATEGIETDISKGTALEKELAFRAQEGEANRENALEVAGIKGRGAAAKEKVPMAALSDINLIDDTLRSGLDLKKVLTDNPKLLQKMASLKNIGGFNVWVSGKLPKELGGDPEMAAAHSELERSFQAYRSAVTKSQASVKELQMLRPILPEPTDTPDTFMDKLDNWIGQSGSARDARVNNLLAAGHAKAENLRATDPRTRLNPEPKRYDQGGGIRTPGLGRASQNPYFKPSE